MQKYRLSGALFSVKTNMKDLNDKDTLTLINELEPVSWIYKNDEEIAHKSIYVGDMETNNKAEYTGLYEGLLYAVENQIHTLHVKGDSNLVIKQIKGEYKVKSENIQTIYQNTKQLSTQFQHITF